MPTIAVDMRCYACHPSLLNIGRLCHRHTKSVKGERKRPPPAPKPPQQPRPGRWIIPPVPSI